MSNLITLATNKIFMSGIFAIVLCQILKMIILSIKEKKLRTTHLFELSGMPSTHTATAIALTTMIYFQQGISTLFIIMLFIVFYVIDETIWVEKSVGLHSRIFNSLFKKLKFKRLKSQLVPESLRERWGHTNDEIIIGAIIGFLLAWLVNSLF